MADFTISGVAYQSRLMDGGTQMFIAKRLMPTLAAVAGVFDRLGGALPTATPADDGDSEEPAAAVPAMRAYVAEMADTFAPVAREIAALPDDDVRFIMDTCLGLTSRKLAVGEGWVPVVQSGHIQDATDGRFLHRLGITWHVLRENFSDMLVTLGLDPDVLKGAVPGLG